MGGLRGHEDNQQDAERYRYQPAEVETQSAHIQMLAISY